MNRSSRLLRPLMLLVVLTVGLMASMPAQGQIIVKPGLPSKPRTFPPSRPPVLTPHPVPPTLPAPNPPSPPIPIPDCVAPPSGLVGWWKGDGNTLDSADGNNGVNQNITYTNGVDGQAFACDPENYPYFTYTGIQVADKPAYALTNSLTIEGWVRPRGDGYVIFWRGDHRPGLDPYYLSMQANHTVRFGICDADGNGAYVDTTLNYFTWTHVAATLDDTSGTLSIYTNGLLAAQAVTAIRPFGALLPDQFPGIGIGDVNDGGNVFPFIGDIDEIALYNRALSTGEIQAIYHAGSAGKCAPVPPAVPEVPEIFSIIPASATKGAAVTINGTNFNPDTASNIVYFGAVQAAVVSASPTNLVVTVPVGATYAPVTVTANGLTADSSQLFEPTFLGNGSGINSASFGPRLDLPSGNGPIKVVIADLDGDGKPDLIVANDYNNTISLYRNISMNDSLTAASFAPRVDLATPSGQYSPFGMVVADVDGDGKPDIIVSDYNNSIVSVYRNTCTPGNISSNLFATRVDFVTGAQPQGVEVRDIDGDGKPDILVANSGDGTVSILRNTGMMGSLTTNSFAPKMDFATGGGCQSVVVGDLDGDGLPDVVTANSGPSTLSLLRNISFPGNIAFAPKADLTVPNGPVQMAIGDLDGDGKLDLTVACYLSQTLSVFRNISAVGSLTTNSFAPRADFPLGGRGHTPVLADLDGDGKPDLVVVTELNSLLSIFQNTSVPGSFTTASLAPRVDFGTGWNAWGVAVGDLDGDDRPDVVFCNSYDNTISIYQNQSSIDEPPFITSQPTNQTVAEADDVVLSVTVGGTGPLSYQWFFNGGTISGANQATLTLTNIHPYQAGVYTVTVTAPFGTVASSNATLTVITQPILVYNYSGSEKITTAGQTAVSTYSGQMFFVPATTNGMFVGWSTVKGKKQYWVSPLSDYLLITVSGAARQTFTVLGQAGQGVDDTGQPHLWSDLHKGQNTQLTIGRKMYYQFPNSMTDTATHIYPDSLTSNMVLNESSSTYTFSTQNTQNANNNGQTVTDLVNALTKSLAKQGYQGP